MSGSAWGSDSSLSDFPAVAENRELTPPPSDPAIRLRVFEGPLDLLLFLIRKNEIEIYDIPIQTVTDQYLEILYGMEKLSLEVAGEFFVMAATLMQIKSRMLLPRDERLPGPEEDEDNIDPRWELVQQLIEYKRFKEASGELRNLILQTQDRLPRQITTAGTEQPPRPLQSVDRIELWNTFNRVLRRLAEKLAVGQIHGETISVADRMEFLLDTLRERSEFRFSELFVNQSRSLLSIVTTFLAILELTRLRRLTLQQDAVFDDILCLRQDATEEDPEDEGSPPPDPSSEPMGPLPEEDPTPATNVIRPDADPLPFTT